MDLARLTHFFTFLLLGGAARSVLVLALVPEPGWSLAFGIAWSAALLVACAATLGPWPDACPMRAARTGAAYLAANALVLGVSGAWAPGLVGLLALVHAGHVLTNRQRNTTCMTSNVASRP
jgi:hypothetical protein